MLKNQPNSGINTSALEKLEVKTTEEVLRINIQGYIRMKIHLGCLRLVFFLTNRSDCITEKSAVLELLTGKVCVLQTTHFDFVTILSP